MPRKRLTEEQKKERAAADVARVRALRQERYDAGFTARGSPRKPPVSEEEKRAKAVRRQQAYRKRKAEKGSEK